jgi:ligand-binding sensor domain-containing protein/signal transduction histidine kinase
MIMGWWGRSAAGLTLWAAATTTPPAAAAGRFVRFSVEQGLSQSTAQVILQDHVGFIWIGTEEGLDRYDGYDFTVFAHRVGVQGSLPHDHVTALYEDRSGRLWVGTDAGLSLFDRSQETFAPVEKISRRVTGIAEDSQGRLWVAAEGFGVFERNPQTGAFALHQKEAHEPGSLASWVPSTLLVDRAGRLWVGTRDAGVDLLAEDGRRFIHFRHDPGQPKSLGHDAVWGLAEDREGHILVATYGGGLSILDPASRRCRTLRHSSRDPLSLGTNLVTTVLVDASGMVWVGTDGAGLQRYDPETKSFRTFANDASDPGSLSQDVIRSLFQDRQGQLWVGTYLGGVSLLRRPPHAFGYYTRDPREAASLSDADVTSFVEDRQGEIWVGTNAGGLHRFDRHKGTFTRAALPPRLQGSLSLLEDRRHRIWIGTYRHGLGRYDPRTGEVDLYTSAPGDPSRLSNDEVWSMAQDQDGELWLGTNEGLDRFDPERHIVTAHYDTPALGGVASPGTRALLLDRQDNLWIGTLGGLHLLPHGQRKLVRIHPEEQGLAQDGVMALHQDAGGRIWIGTHGGGLKRLDGPTAALVSYKIAPSNVVYAIQEDGAGRLWLSTNHGLARFDPGTQRVESFDLSNGLESLQFNHGSSLRTREGRLLFGSVNGFYDFDPAAITSDDFSPPVVLTGFRVFNEPVRTPAALASLKRMTLSYRDKVFSLSFAALDFTFPRNNAYQYRLMGFNDQWLPLGSRREVTFTNLDPGTYVFQVKASNSDGVWGERGKASLEIEVTPPLWGRLWFRLLAVLVLALALFFSYSARIRRVSARVAERTRAELATREAEQRYRRIFEESEAELKAALRRSEMMSAMGMLVAGVAHEVRNPLFGISATLDTFDARLGPAAEKVAPLIARMRLEVDRLANLMRDLLEYGKPIDPALSSEQARSVVLEAVESSSTVAATSGVAIVEKVARDLPPVSMDRPRLVQVFENLIQNAVQHSPVGGVVEVGASVEGSEGRRRVVITVADSGRGFDVEDLPRVFEPFFSRRKGGTGLGLAIVQHIVEAHGGTVVAANRTSGGAVVAVALPVVVDPPTRA